MPFFVGAGSKRANCIGVVLIILGGALFYFFIVRPSQSREAEALAAWNRGEGRPASVTLVHQKNTDVTLALPKTLSTDEVNDIWKTCPRNCKNHEILRYPFVYRIGQLYDNALVTGGAPEDKCWVFPLKTPVNELRIASTVEGLTLTYPRDRRAIIICYVNSDGPSIDAEVVVWSDSSPFDYMSYW